MPSILHELSGHRDVEGLRAVVKCPAKATVLREGPAQESGPGAAWLACLCPAHAADLDGWAGAADHPDTGTVPCGTVLDYRSPEAQLQSHADLWLTPLTGIDPKTYGGVWSDVLDQADRVLLAQASEDGPLQSMLVILDLARRSASPRRCSPTPSSSPPTGPR